MIELKLKHYYNTECSKLANVLYTALGNLTMNCDHDCRYCENKHLCRDLGATAEYAERTEEIKRSEELCER